MPRPDAPTAGKRRPVRLTEETWRGLEERYTLLMCQMLPIFGRERTAEIALCSALRCVKLKRVS